MFRIVPSSLGLQVGMTGFHGVAENISDIDKLEWFISSYSHIIF